MSLLLERLNIVLKEIPIEQTAFILLTLLDNSKNEACSVHIKLCNMRYKNRIRIYIYLDIGLFHVLSLSNLHST
jgi:hypothetical protein